MASLSVSEAAVAGFKVIGQRPVSVFLWGVFAIVFGVLPVISIVGPMIPAMADFAQQAKLHPETPPSPQAFTHMYGRMFAMNPLIRLLSLVIKAMLTAAVFRAVLEPRRKAFAYLRVSMQEVWIVLVNIVRGILIVIGVAIVAVIIGVICFAVGAAVSKTAAVIVGIVLGLVAIIGLIYVVLRLSLATPMSFEARSFMLFESWTLTRGHTVSLLLMSLLLFVIIMVMEGVVFGVLGVPMMLLAPHMGSEAEIMAFMHQSPEVMLRALGPVLVVGGLIGSFVIGAISAIVTAPWAAAYRMLKPAA